eukprot:SAG31_NODE_54_length_29987_cov_4.570664_14_plen_128_part_00
MCDVVVLLLLDAEGGWQTFDGVVKKHGSGKYVSGDNSYEVRTLIFSARARVLPYRLRMPFPTVAQGEWKEDMMDGKGEFKFASGACYSGTWVKNQFMGEGTYTWPDKTTYAGGWADNKCAANLYSRS